MRLLLATTNRKKRRELAQLLEPLGVQVLGPAEVGGVPEVVEDGETFAANARKKAASAAVAGETWALADDSGLEVEVLGGQPGVRSARYAGEEASDEANNAKLLEALKDVPPEKRRARFVCALALARPDGSIAAEFSGRCHGRILHAPLGASGFGYDPLFLFDEPGENGSGATFAQLSTAEKSRVSHRGRALAELAARLSQFVDLQEPTGAP